MVDYIISGSRVSILKQTISRQESPFFEHFKPMIVEGLPAEEAYEMLRQLYRRSGYEVDEKLLARIVSAVGEQPFYLQLIGEEICRRTETKVVDEASFKEAFQETVMTEGGRLNSYFDGIFQSFSESTLLERTAIAIAEGKTQITEIGKAIGLTGGAAYTAIRRLQELNIITKKNAEYDYVDPLLKRWVIGTKTPLKAVITPYLLGDETERNVAQALGKEGFRLVYQSRASRGAFDLLAIIDSLQVGLQVKRTTRQTTQISQPDLERMIYEAERLHWIPAIAIDRGRGIILYASARLLHRAGKSTIREEDCEPSLLRMITKT
jgi:Holliday junction resolvase